MSRKLEKITSELQTELQRIVGTDGIPPLSGTVSIFARIIYDDIRRDKTYLIGTL